MMLYPSIDKLIQKVPSKYELIILASKRAHEMHVYQNMQLPKYQSDKLVGKALEEVAADLVNVKEV